MIKQLQRGIDFLETSFSLAEIIPAEMRILFILICGLQVTLKQVKNDADWANFLKAYATEIDTAINVVKEIPSFIVS